MAEASTNLPVNGSRLWGDLMTLAEITDPNRPYTRRSFTTRFLEGRAWLTQRFEQAGLAVRIDSGGNLIGRLDGADERAGTIMIGSHSDTVPAGGRFDGIAGLLTALEIARSLRESGRVVRHSLEVVDFLAEEPSDYGLSCVGSRAMSGVLEPRLLAYENANGEQLGAAIDRMGGDSRDMGKALRDDVVAFFELHIEQGIVLEGGGIDLGIVTGIAGITRIELRFEGRADHAGTTPMALRRDAGLAAAKTMARVNEKASGLADAGRGHFVATVGVVEIAPNAANVVPGDARLIIDIRAEDSALKDEFVEGMDVESAAIAAQCGVARTTWTLLSDSSPVACARSLQELLEKSARKLGLSTLSMASGAGHDAAFLARVAPAAMVFVPCRNGRSHAPEEWAEADAIAAGAAAIHDAVLALDAMDIESIMTNG